MTDTFFQPVSGMSLPRFAGVPTFMRLPYVTPDHPRHSDVDIGFIGLPWDGGTSNRPGARHGPRQVRDASTMIRAQHPVTGFRPFEARNCADLGDVGPNPVDTTDTLARITEAISRLRTADIRPISVGGDHLCTLPVLRALAVEGPLGLVHFDSHTDLYPPYFGGRALTHGNPFRVAVEEGLLDPRRMVQIGIRGTCYDSDDIDFARANGIRIIRIEEFFARGIPDVMAEARSIVGEEPTYLSYDIDFVDPTFAPGTGTPEVGGPNAFQALSVLRELKGLTFAGADLVEVSPPFDQSGGTAWLAASLLFEILCVMAE
ncbi:agmatinase [Haematobacter missouriensis]|uniref:Agmatinase n=1 Tax=Haematobacter missouriensis TaxID=366616 RepID=A0A212AWS3_9RHOB|nr:agmatinase [Haematobacter missouriensis]KFI33880.1 agmatinase [Haematobacter missouriensis]OWJ71348.1 agmatinase [Haematobacter missouriensis]OWJ85876.1 agmatinase [Haematobacter missouriensis]